MQQLSAQDATFVYGDTRHANANVTLIHIYDQSTAPGGQVRFKTLLAQIESRIPRLPRLRQKVQRVPMDLDLPYWVDDPEFDLEYHVRHIALPKPGDWRQFCIQVSRIHARPLAPDRPLWEMHVIEGLDGFLDLPSGSFALVTKVHHAAIDIEQGSEITALLHDLSPQPPDAAPPPPWFPEPPPGLVTTVKRGVGNTVQASLRLAGPLSSAVRNAWPAAVALAGDLLTRPRRMPVTRFNAVISPHRVFETRRFALEEFKAIRTLVEDASVNDVVLAVCGGALRRYLALHDELPPATLSALAPLYLRGGGEAERAELAWTRVPLATDRDDPVERLAAIVRHTASSKEIERAVGARELTDFALHVPAATLALSAKLLGSVSARRRSPLASCTVTNVPGPAVPLYLCGARMTYFSALMPIHDGMGLVFAVTSYDGKVIVSPTSCRELMPDPAVFAQCLRDSFQEYLALARRPAQRRRAPRATAAARRASARGRRPSTSPPA